MGANQGIGKKDWHTIVIGAGQSGLATGYYLAQSGDDFVIVDENAVTGSNWKQRWDSLRLFTPAQYDGLPGMTFPAVRNSFPSKDEVADYLASYAKNYNLPVRHGCKVTKLVRVNGKFQIETSQGVYTARRVVVATGTNHCPKLPSFSGYLNRNIFQLHSSQYVNPGSVPEGNVLVVGAGASGVEIAIELSASHPTIISGHPTPHIPDAVFRYAGRLYWWFANQVLTVKTPVGRKARQSILKGGGPLINVSAEDLKRAGVELVPRVVGVENGYPKLADGRIVETSSVVWCTGFRPDFSWIEPEVVNETGWPVANRGVSTMVDGLYFVGMLFQYGLTSGLIGGVGRDAEFVVRQMTKKVN